MISWPSLSQRQSSTFGPLPSGAFLMASTNACAAAPVKVELAIKGARRAAKLGLALKGTAYRPTEIDSTGPIVAKPPVGAGRPCGVWASG